MLLEQPRHTARPDHTLPLFMGLWGSDQGEIAEIS